MAVPMSVSASRILKIALPGGGGDQRTFERVKALIAAAAQGKAFPGVRRRPELGDHPPGDHQHEGREDQRPHGQREGGLRGLSQELDGHKAGIEGQEDRQHGGEDAGDDGEDEADHSLALLVDVGLTGQRVAHVFQRGVERLALAWCVHLRA